MSHVYVENAGQVSWVASFFDKADAEEFAEVQSKRFDGGYYVSEKKPTPEEME